MYWTLKRMLSWGGIILIVGVITVYTYIQSRAIIEGPEIILESPLESTSSTTLIIVRGSVKNAKSTTLQGRPIFIDTMGRFGEKLLLAEGYNIIVLTAVDAQGRTKRKTWEMVYEDPTPTDTAQAASSSQPATKLNDVIQ